MSGQPNVERVIFAGAYCKGMFASRPTDTVGFAVSLLGVTPRITERNTGLARSTGGQTSRTEIGYEVNDGFGIAPGFRFKPFLQCISHPEQATSARPSGDNTHALFVGGLLELDVVNLFGLPTLSR